MATDPTISLGIQSPQNAGIQNLHSLAETVSTLNNIKMFQQTYAARQQAGQIMASAPDMETGLNQIMQSPAAPFMGEFLNQVRSSMLANQQYQNEVSKNAREGVQEYMKGAPGSVLDPGLMKGIIGSAIATTSKNAQPQLVQALQGLHSSLYDGLPDDPSKWSPQDHANYTKRATALGVATGMGTDQLGSVIGKAGTLDTGGGTYTGTFAPAVEGGGFTSAGGAEKTLPPQAVGLPGGLTTTAGGGMGRLFGAGNGLAPSGGGGGATMTPPAPAGNGLSLGGGDDAAARARSLNSEGNPRFFTGDGSAGTSPAARSAAAGGGVAASAPGMAGDGKPLIDPAVIAKGGVGLGTAIGGINVLSPAQLDQNKELIQNYAGPGTQTYNNAQTTLASLRYMDSAFDNLAKGGGFLVPGTAAQFRGDVAKTVNTMAQMFDGKPPFDVTKVMSIEDFNKETRRMGAQVMAQLVGQQHQAAQTIQNMTSSVPGIENTYMGGKLVLNGLQAMSQRLIDERNFQNEWQNAHQGSLIGSTEAFNNLHPAEQYAEQVLNKFGLNEKGFQSPEAIKSAIQGGYLTKAQGVQLLQQHFPDQFGTP